jgi:hypothetical protein
MGGRGGCGHNTVHRCWQDVDVLLSTAHNVREFADSQAAGRFEGYLNVDGNGDDEVENIGKLEIGLV